jgi:tRNA nucleotidyltransferase (CCA-adding enzyme)
METYLVGGAVRDKLLGLPVRERDWVVVGATPALMLELGYMPVGKDFPVFLHPETKEEYALARTERKTGPGYTGFETCADPDITLEEDLLRRDLTINAMAESPAGELIDPYGGRDDLDNGVLRHVSPAFAEDPVRILRIARFAARFAARGFHVAHSTNAMMRDMVQSGEVNHLVPERVWAELVKALETDTPARFFDVLAGCSALPTLFPEFAFADNGEAPAAPSTPSTPSTHGHHGLGLPVLEQAITRSENTAIRFAALVCDMDNGTTGGLDNDALATLCTRHRVPNACRELAEMALRQREQAHIANALPATELLDLLNTLDAFRRTERFGDFLEVCDADARARNLESNNTYLNKALSVARAVRVDDTRKQELSGSEIGEALNRERITEIEKITQRKP